MKLPVVMSMQWRLFGVLLLGLLVLSSFGSAAVPSKGVSPALAEKVARSYVQWIAVNIPDFKEWRDVTLGKPVTYYFPNGEKSAYEFAVFKNGKSVGFILVSARKDMPPVLEFSKAKPPSWKLEKVKELAEKKGYKTGRLLYYGALTYSIDIGNGKAIGLKDMKMREYPMKVELKFNKEKARSTESYTSLSLTLSTTPIFLDGNSIEGVPAWTSEDDGGSSIQYPNNVGLASDPWDDWDGCSPIAASMVIAYYEPQLRDDWNREAIIDILHHTMGTDYSGSTVPWNIDTGIDWFDDEYNDLRNQGIVSDPLYHTFDGSNDYYVSQDDVIREVDNKQPFVLNMFPYGSSLTEGHSVTVVGYSRWLYSDGTSSWIVMYLEIHNTWDYYATYITFGDWTTAVATYVDAY
jgi:hypothetical protein